MLSLMHASQKRKTFIYFALLTKQSPSMNKASVSKYFLATFALLLSTFSNGSQTIHLATEVAW